MFSFSGRTFVIGVVGKVVLKILIWIIRFLVWGGELLTFLITILNVKVDDWVGVSVFFIITVILCLFFWGVFLFRICLVIISFFVEILKLLEFVEIWYLNGFWFFGCFIRFRLWLVVFVIRFIILVFIGMFFLMYLVKFVGVK